MSFAGVNFPFTDQFADRKDDGCFYYCFVYATAYESISCSNTENAFGYWNSNGSATRSSLASTKRENRRPCRPRSNGRLPRRARGLRAGWRRGQVGFRQRARNTNRPDGRRICRIKRSVIISNVPFSVGG